MSSLVSFRQFFFIILILESFSRKFQSPQVSRTLLSIVGDLNNAVDWAVPTRPVFSKSSSHCTNSVVTAPRQPITIGIIVTFSLQRLFNSLAKSRYLSLVSLSFSFTLSSAETAKSTILQVLSVFVDYYKVWSSGRDLVIRLYLKVPEEFIPSFIQDRFWVVHIPFVRVVKLQLFVQVTLSTQSSRVLYSFCANVLHSLIMGLVV